MSSGNQIFLKKNIDLLTHLYPRLRKEVLDRYEPAEELLVEEGSAGFPTLRLNSRYLHSRHNPEREAERLVGKICGETSGTGVFLGFGLGYQVEAFRRQFPDAPVIIVEQDPAFFLKALTVRDMAGIFSGPVSLLLDSPAEELIPLLDLFPENHIHMVRLQALVDNDPGYYGKVADIAKVGASRRKVNTATLKRFGRRWVRNLARNIKTMENAGNVGVWGRVFTGIPAFIAAAGPSLDDALPFLKDIRRKAVIISSDTAARLLLKHGIDPDFIILVDPQYWNTRHLDGLDLSRSILISEPATHSGVFHREYRGIYLSGSIFPLGSYLEPEGKERHRLGAGGSVATTAWDFGRLVGAGPLFLSGLDLGFPDGLTHYRGSYFEERIRNTGDRFRPHEQGIFNYLHSGYPYLYEDYEGNPILTDRRLEVYRRWFEEQLVLEAGAAGGAGGDTVGSAGGEADGADSSGTFTLSSRGVLVRGIEPRGPEVFESLPDRRREIDEKIAVILRRSNNPQTDAHPGTAVVRGDKPGAVDERVRKLRQELQKLRTLAGEGADIVEAVKTRLSAAPPDHEIDRHETQLLQKLDKIDHRILNMSERQVAAFLITPILQEIETRAGQTGSMVENLELSQHLYKELVTSVDFHLGLFSNI